jgi:hypothetical protein
MFRVAALTAVAICMCGPTRAFQEPDDLLKRFLARMNVELDRLPNYVCQQTVERFGRSAAERPWEKIDTLRFEVALVGNQELYAAPGARQFQDRPLAEMAGRGTISTGQLALLAKHVFGSTAAHFTYRAKNERAGRIAHQYDYDVAPEHSSYRLRSGTAESTVGFQGAFWIDDQTLDLIRLEVEAYDIPERLGLAEANTAMSYSRAVIDATEILLPVAASHSIAAVDGVETMNRIELSACRHYRTEATIQFAGETASPESGESVARNRIAEPAADALPAGALIEITLDSNLDPAIANIGDPIAGSLARPVKDGEAVLVPQGAAVRGRVVRLDRQNMPFPIYEVGLEFDSVEIGDRKLPLAATMEEAGPAAGLIKQAKRLDPTFTRQRTARMDILVREVQRGQGILYWEARRGSIPRGLRMKWRVEKERSPGDGR